MSVSESATPGGQPSTTQPIAGPWLSPKEVTVKSLPRVLPDIAKECSELTLGERLQERVPPRDAEAGHVGRHCAETAFTARSREVHVDPRTLVGKPFQQSCGED